MADFNATKIVFLAYCVLMALMLHKGRQALKAIRRTLNWVTKFGYFENMYFGYFFKFLSGHPGLLL